MYFGAIGIRVRAILLTTLVVLLTASVTLAYTRSESGADDDSGRVYSGDIWMRAWIRTGYIGTNADYCLHYNDICLQHAGLEPGEPITTGTEAVANEHGHQKWTPDAWDDTGTWHLGATWSWAPNIVLGSSAVVDGATFSASYELRFLALEISVDGIPVVDLTDLWSIEETLNDTDSLPHKAHLSHQTSWNQQHVGDPPTVRLDYYYAAAGDWEGHNPWNPEGMPSHSVNAKLFADATARLDKPTQ